MRVRSSAAHNALSGTIPPSWARCTRLAALELQGNAGLCGGVPQALAAREVGARHWGTTQPRA